MNTPMMNKTLGGLLVGSVVLAGVGCAAIGCGSTKDDPLSFLTNHAVGTYIGGGSIFGADNCTYAGTPGVFMNDEGKPSSEPAAGPRFVFAAGTITQECTSGHKSKINAVVPTGAKIIKAMGPGKVKVGSKGEMFKPVLVANGKELGGNANEEWKLGHDCAGIADFGPVLGSQDTGGKDRSRTLEAKAKGKCTVILGLTTGSPLNGSFNPQSFQTEMLVTIE